MDDLKGLLAKRLKQAKPNVKLHSDAHQLADEISAAFGERKRFAMYLGTIKRVGTAEARRIFRELQQEGGARHSGKLFMFLCRKAPKAPPEGAAAEKKTETEKKP
jgi:hypothetical protein